MNYLVSIISIGTELTTGEVINSNASWLSAKLTDLGFIVSSHITVPDDRALIQETLDMVNRKNKLILVTGGLGPTSDDFTRDEIAKFCNLPLEWSEDAWQATCKRLQSLNVSISENNKQQCFFPKNSEIFINPQGTAAAFLVNQGTTSIYVLPGPPSEISAIWKEHLERKLQAAIPENQRLKLHRWVCLGKSESHLGELVEKTLAGSHLAIGYRARVPYVDVKVWYSKDQEKDFLQSWKPKLTQELNDCLVGENDFDSAKIFAVKSTNKSILILDTATNGQLANRIFQTDLMQDSKVQIITTKLDPQDKKLDSIVVKITSNIESGSWHLALSSSELNKEFKETSRYKGVQHQKRLSTYICEKSLILLSEWI